MMVEKTKESHKTEDGKAKFTPGSAIKNMQTGAIMSNVEPKASVSYMLMAKVDNNNSYKEYICRILAISLLTFIVCICISFFT